MPCTKPLILTDRLAFRLIAAGDLDDLVRLDGDPEVRAHFPDGPVARDAIEARIAANEARFEAVGYADFAVVERATGEFAGRAGFAPLEGGEIEVGYVFLKPFWGRGLAQESLRALLGWADDNIDAERIIALAPKPHAASFNVMRKSGMRYFKSDTAHGVECDFYEYPLRNESGSNRIFF